MTVADDDEGEELRERLDAAVRAVDAPDVVFALSRHGRRFVHCGGTAPPPPVPRDRLRYEIGSASKPFAGLLLAHLTHLGRVNGDDPAVAHLSPNWSSGPHRRHRLYRPAATLTHLITHTSGLPRIPADFYPQALHRWSTNPYVGYPAHRVVRAFLRDRVGPAPGNRWRYSSFGVAVLGHALAAATQTPWEDLLTSQVLRPLGLTDTTPRSDGPYGSDSPAGSGADATGHRADGTTPTPPLRIGGFQAAGGLRATPHDLLTFLEAHVDPGGSAAPAGSALADALRAVRRPVLRRGLGHRHVHTLTWFQHPSADGGTFCFHCGATMGQQALLGFRPETGTALAAVATRRMCRRDRFLPTAYALLSEV